jgi:hypothetical protein
MTACPRPREGLAFVPTADGYVVDGGPRREHLTGRLAREALPVLFRLLDGARTVEQLEEALGAPVRPIVDLLVQRDLVRFPAEPDPDPVRVFLQRTLPAPMADGVLRRLHAARVTVTGDPVTAEPLARVLRQSGVGTVGAAGGPADLAIAVPDGAGTHPAVAAGTAAGTALRRLGGFPDAPLPQAAPAKRYLTERRLPLRRSPHPLVRTMAWILAGQRGVPAAGPDGAVRTYLLGDLTGKGCRAYAVDPAGGALVELPGAARPDGADVTLVVTGDRSWITDALREKGGRLLLGDTGLLVARLADDARSAGWAARMRAPDGLAEPLDLDPERERVTAVLGLTRVRRVARPVRRGRRPAAGGDPRRLADQSLTRADEVCGPGRLRYAFRPRDAVGDYLTDRGVRAADVLVFTAGPDPRLVAKAAVAAGTVRLLAAEAGIACGLLPGLGDHDPGVLYGCALGRPGEIPAAIIR